MFADSDVYKWLEAAAWEYGRDPDEHLLERQRELTALVAAAQRDDGYLDSVVQLRNGDEALQRLPWSHELYCAGHLIQAAVAQVRGTGDRELLDVAIRLADHLVATFGDGDGSCARSTAIPSSRWRWSSCTERPARGLPRPGAVVRRARAARASSRPTATSRRTSPTGPGPRGHHRRGPRGPGGVPGGRRGRRRLETGDAELLAALKTQFAHMVRDEDSTSPAGSASRWEGEAFGDQYELPPDRAYAETCAAIGGMQWAWRMLLATGEASYARRRSSGCSTTASSPGSRSSGTEYFYVNPLQLRGDAHADNDRSPANGRRGWFDCACCPPNIMRTLSSLAGYLASSGDAAVQLHQYAAGVIKANGVELQVETAYPWDGAVRITASGPTAVELRIPAWAEGATVNGKPVDAGTYARVEADVIDLQLPMAARVIAADPRVDAVRGCVALERGPLVYAVEQADQQANVDDLHLLPEASIAASHDDGLLDGVTVLTTRGRIGTGHQAGWPFTPGAADQVGDEVDVVAVPYYAWANREIGAMRVWLPRA